MMRTICVQSFSQWRKEARELLSTGVPPHAVQWSEALQSDDLFGAVEQPRLAYGAPDATTTAPENTRETARMPREMLRMLETAACFRSPDRYAFLYKIVWRWQLGQKDVLSPADEDGARLNAMVKTIRREQHKMHAYLRFRERPAAAGAPQFVAWFEPEHDVLPQVAEHFSRRMGHTTWMIGTPQATMLWDGSRVVAGPPVMQGPEDIADTGEAMWLTYYRSTFNPARLNVSVMQGHIASRYWKNMPEGALVPAMIAEAAAGAQRDGQTKTVGARNGVTIPISADDAQPKREQPSTLDQCRRCDLWRNATQAVPGVGPAAARIMLVGEQPGDQEDLAGTPFIGPAGQVLDDAFAQSGLARESIYLTNAVKHFKWEPRGKRRLHKTPAQMEVTACSYWLEEELASVQPDVIVALGGTALKAILGNPKATLGDRIGVPFQHEGRWIVVVYHPSYILRVPDAEAKAKAMAVLIEGLKFAQNLST
ncbi:MAG: UdgX family uracil-DNA binding protein [Herminiimonas sp.]|nr:UdgX family uracil-DNA binding protein [Herminiimonas sp.]